MAGTKRNRPCPCGSGKRYMHCCGALSGGEASPVPGVIQRTLGYAGTIINGITSKWRTSREQRGGDSTNEEPVQPTAQTNDSPAGHVKWYKRGNEHYDRQQFGEALAAFEKALELGPANVNAWNAKGAMLCELKRFEEAHAAFEKALELDPDYVLAWFNKGVVLPKLKRIEEALAAFEKALELDPDYADAWNNKGSVLRDLKRFEEALAAYEKALELDPDYANTWNNKGNVLCEFKRFEEALAAYEKALELDPDHVGAWNGKGNVLRKLNRFEEALAAYEKALELDPDYVEAWNGKGNVLGDLKRFEEALAAYEKALELDPDHVNAWNGNGGVLHDLKRFKEALAAYDKALELDPDHVGAWNGKGNVLRKLNRFEEALAAYEKALELDPDHVVVWHNKGLVLYDLGRMDEAAACHLRYHYLGGLDEDPEHINHCLRFFANDYDLPLAVECIFTQKPQLYSYSSLMPHITGVRKRYGDAFALLHYIEDTPGLASKNDVVRMLGILRFHMGGPVEALESWYPLVRENGSDLQAHYYCISSLNGFCEPAGDELAAGVRAAEHCLAEAGTSDNPVVQLYYAGLVFSLAQQEQKALECFSKAASLEPGFLPPLYMAVSLYLSDDNHERADRAISLLLDGEIQNSSPETSAPNFISGVIPFGIDPAGKDLLANVQHYCFAAEIRPCLADVWDRLDQYTEKIDTSAHLKQLLKGDDRPVEHPFAGLLLNEKNKKALQHKARQHEARQLEESLEKELQSIKQLMEWADRGMLGKIADTLVDKGALPLARKVMIYLYLEEKTSLEQTMLVLTYLHYKIQPVNKTEEISINVLTGTLLSYIYSHTIGDFILPMAGLQEIASYYISAKLIELLKNDRESGFQATSFNEFTKRYFDHIPKYAPV